MRTPNQLSQRQPLRFNITPLIDVVFLLIIFFLVASHFVRNEQSENVSLPVATLGMADHDAASHRITITVRADGSYFVGSQQQSEEAIAGQLQTLSQNASAKQLLPEVRIRSDRTADYRHVRTLVEKCAAVNIRRIYFAVAADSASDANSSSAAGQTR